jgi:nitroimidazol reductase NimA-like FMN-containing flavoprotein (pyridoxamine 5'-phosphate oxidase superfamily)
VVHEIIDASLVAHVGTVRDGRPVVIPMFCARDGESLLLHGAPAAGVIQRAQRGLDICAEMTLIDGLVLARSAFHHSVNYRSVVLIGRPEKVPAEDKERCLDLLVERLVPGRIPSLRPTTAEELRLTSVLRLPITEGSAKVRTGGPIDDEEDYALPIWAGVLPLVTTVGEPIPDAAMTAPLDVPSHVADYRHPGVQQRP